MKILFCNKFNFSFSGTEVYLAELREMLRARGHEVAEFAMEHPQNEESEWVEHFMPLADFRARGMGVAQRLRLAGRATYSRLARRKIGRLVEAFRPDVAHVRNIYHHLSPSVLWELRGRGVGVVYHLNDFKLICPSYNLVSHGRVCEKCFQGRYWHAVTEGCHAQGRVAGLVLAAEAYLHRWVGTYAKCVNRFVAPTEFVKRKLVENGWPGERIEVLPHFQRAAGQPAEMPERGYVLYFGRLSAEKGVRELLLAMREAPDVPLIVAGDGPQRTELEGLAQRMGLRGARFTGRVSRGTIEELIRGARFTVMPSLAYETMGKTILESYAQGRAVVATDLGSRREVVEDGVTGLLWEVGNAEALAEKIAWLWGRPDVAREMGEAGWRRVKERHAPEEHYEKLMQIYERAKEETVTVINEAGKKHRKSRFLASLGMTDKDHKAKREGLRVAFIGGRGVGGNYGGIEVFYEEAGRELVRRGHEVTVYCRSHYTAAMREWGGMRVVRLPTVRRKHWETLVHTAVATAHAMFARYDMVHYHAMGPAVFAWLPRLVGTKTVVTVQGLDWQRRKWGRFARACLKVAERMAVWAPSRTIVVSRRLQDYFREKYGRETEYVPNGVRLVGRREARNLTAWGIEAGKYVLYLGRLSPEKNVHVLVEAFEQMEGSTKLVVAGEDAYAGKYLARLRERAGERAKFVGWVSGEARDELLANAAVFVLPSEVEGLSLALLEAMAAGVCVLVSDIPENLEAIGETGYSFRCGDAEDLERMLRVLLAEPRLRAAAGRAGRERVKREYLWGRVVEELERVYRDGREAEKKRGFEEIVEEVRR